LIVTATGKNVAPAVIEDRIRAHALVSQVMVVGDAQPYIAALVAIDAPHVSWLRHLEAADEQEIELDKILGTLLAVAPVVGSAKIVAACAKIVRAAALGEEFGVLAEG